MKFIGLSWKERNIQMQFNAEYRTEMDKLMLSIGKQREKPKDAVVNKEQEEWHLERLEITYFIWLEALALHPMFPEGQHAVLKAHCKGGAQITPHSLDPCFPNASGEPSSKCVNKHCQPKPCELLEMTHHLNYYSYCKTDDGKWEFSVQGQREHRAASSEWLNSVICRVCYSRNSCLTAAVQALEARLLS